MKVEPNEIATAYPLDEITYLPNDGVMQYNEDNKHIQTEEKVLIDNSQIIHQSELINDAGQNDLTNIESITVLRPHQTDMGEQTYNTFSYNFIL